MPKQHESHFEETDTRNLENLAAVLRSTLRRIEKILEWPAYNFLIHTAPLQEPANAWFHWHIEVIPKLTRVAGFEWGSGFYINPTPPEESAQFLREAVI
jgi:UDPglucose--hexose-1-phosphate uridylyltransferase